MELGRHDIDRIAGSDLVVASPGIPPTSPVLGALRARGIHWISEPELAVRVLRAPLIAITGTNGKTTTATLVAHLLATAGVRVGLGGNIGAGLGPPASTLARLDPAPEWVVLEMSSFQLADVERFRPDIGVLTNLAPDHLDRYDRLEDYYADKARLFLNADETSSWVLPRQREALALSDGVPGRRLHFARDPGPDVDAWLSSAGLHVRMDSSADLVCAHDEFPLLGTHNGLNALAAALTARCVGLGADAIRAGLASARPLPHRLEPVVERDGVLWVDDSKATNVAAAASGISSMDRPVVALLGGKDKGESFIPLREVLAERARVALPYGAVRTRLSRELRGAVPLDVIDGDMTEVVAKARALARPGDVVLLSPACSSYDMFTNYEERGRRFAALARGEE